MKGRTAGMPIKRHSMIAQDQRFRIQAVEMSYLRGTFGLNEMDGESNKGVYGKFGMYFKGEERNCGVMEVFMYNFHRWFGHLERMGRSEIRRGYTKVV